MTWESYGSNPYAIAFIEATTPIHNISVYKKYMLIGVYMKNNKLKFRNIINIINNLIILNETEK